jgi:NADPH:quinone reductase-like Zn-dependent oxidoreductase
MYPPPPGASELLGLELSGVVVAVGEGAEGWRGGERVACLVGGKELVTQRGAKGDITSTNPTKGTGES